MTRVWRKKCTVILSINIVMCQMCSTSKLKNRQKLSVMLNMHKSSKMW